MQLSDLVMSITAGSDAPFYIEFSKGMSKVISVLSSSANMGALYLLGMQNTYLSSQVCQLSK